jgi:hypothetical protein
MTRLTSRFHYRRGRNAGRRKDDDGGEGPRVQDSLCRGKVNLYTSWVHLDRVRIISKYTRTLYTRKQGRAKRSPMIDTVRIQEDNRMRAEGNKKASVFY